MVVTRKSVETLERSKSNNRSLNSEAFKQTGFSTKKIFRKHPFLAGMHRGVDGALIGAIFCAALMSALALHSQYLWSLSFSRLEATRRLNQRLEESITSLEQHFLASTSIPKSMVPTKAADLLYIDSLDRNKLSSNEIGINFSSLYSLFYHPITHGY